MGLLVIALAVGIVCGLAAGGRLAEVGRRPLRWLGLLGGALVFQAVPQFVDVGAGTGLACVLASYLLLLAFGLANIRLVGMPVVLAGLLCNIAVITANGGMPVRPEAVLAVDRTIQLDRLDLGAKRHLEDDSDRLTFLGDVVPVPPLGQVISFGDLILAVGVVDLAFRLLKPAAGRRRRPTVAEVIALLPSPPATELSRSA